MPPQVSVFLYERSPLAGRLRSPWAVKRVNRRHATTQFGARLEEEAKVLRSLDHPNIVRYKAFVPMADGVHSLAMEVGQQSLQERLEGREEEGAGACPAATVGHTAARVAAALHYLHTERSVSSQLCFLTLAAGSSCTETSSLGTSWCPRTSPVSSSVTSG